MPRTAIKPSRQAPPPSLGERAGERLAQTAFLLALVLVIVRATIHETASADTLPIPGAPPVPTTPGPATGLVLDLLACLPALLVLARRLIDPNFRLRFAWSAVPMSLLAGWTLASVLWASNKFAAIISASHWAAALVLLWSVAQLVGDWQQLRLVAAVSIGLLLVMLVEGYSYRFVDLPELQRDWRERHEQLLKQRGAEPGSREAIQLARNIETGEVRGFDLSRNTYAAVLVLLMFIGAGVLLQRKADGAAVGWIAPLALILLASLFMLYAYVQSKTAYATPFIGAALLAALTLRARWIAAHAGRVYWGAVALLAIGLGAVVGHGLRHGTLFHVSLTFRWQYWVGAARVFAHHPWIGVGWANFGPWYLIYRLPQAAEEPVDPHNFLVRAFVELGVIGGAFMIAWMLRLWWELTVTGSSPAQEANQAAAAHPQKPAMGTAVKFLVALGVAAMVANAVASVDWSQSGSWIFLELFKRALYLLALLAGLVLVALRSSEQQYLDDRPAPWILRALLVGLGLFLLHNLIDFSLFEPGPMFLFALLVGAALGIRVPRPEPHPGGRVAPLMAFFAAGIAWLVAAGAGVAPLVEAESLARDADELVRQSRAADAPPQSRTDEAKLEQAGRELIAAYHELPINAEYAFRAEQAAALRQATPLMLRQLLDEAIATDPMSARYRAVRAESNAQTGETASAIADYQEALRLDPYDMTLRLAFADLLARSGRRAEARQQYQRVLELNANFPPDEIKRLSPQKVEQIRGLIWSLPS